MKTDEYIKEIQSHLISLGSEDERKIRKTLSSALAGVFSPLYKSTNGDNKKVHKARWDALEKLGILPEKLKEKPQFEKLYKLIEIAPVDVLKKISLHEY